MAEAETKPDTSTRPTAPLPVWADDLVSLLEQTGTGRNKLEIIAAAKVERFGDLDLVHLSVDDPRRHLTALEAFEILLKEPSISPLTKEKARQLVKTGVYIEPNTAPTRIDSHVPPPPKNVAPPKAVKTDILDTPIKTGDPIVTPGSMDLAKPGEGHDEDHDEDEDEETPLEKPAKSPKPGKKPPGRPPKAKPSPQMPPVPPPLPVPAPIPVQPPPAPAVPKA